MQNRNDEPRLQHAPLRLPRKDDGRGRVNRRAMGVGRVNEWRPAIATQLLVIGHALGEQQSFNAIYVLDALGERSSSSGAGALTIAHTRGSTRLYASAREA